MTYTLETLTTDYKLKSGMLLLVFDGIIEDKPEIIEVQHAKWKVVQFWHVRKINETHIVATVK